MRKSNKKGPNDRKKENKQINGKLSMTRGDINHIIWQGQRDLNPRHQVLETCALPTELYP